MEATTTQQQERIFFQDNNVTVTQARFIANGKTFAMRNISSVSNYQIKKSYTGAGLMIILGLILFMFDEARGAGIFSFLVGVLWAFMIKDDYSVRINSNSGEADGFVSKDKSYVQQIVDAVNDAMVFRG